MQRYRADAEQVQKCRSAEVVHKKCRRRAEEVQWWNRGQSTRCRGGAEGRVLGTELVQVQVQERWCRHDAGAAGDFAEMGHAKGAGRCWC